MIEDDKYNYMGREINLGYRCQHCGSVIDGEETGSPRNCVACESDNPRYEEER